MKSILAVAAILALAGCASYDGHTLVATRSTAADVETLMGAPAERLERAGGEKVWFFPRLRETFAVVLGPDNLVRAVEPRRTRENFAKLVVGTPTRQVREILGPPGRIVRMDLQQRDVHEYEYRYYDEYRVVWVQLSYDGAVKEVLDMLDYSAYPPSGPSLP